MAETVPVGWKHDVCEQLSHNSEHEKNTAQLIADNEQAIIECREELKVQAQVETNLETRKELWSMTSSFSLPGKAPSFSGNPPSLWKLSTWPTFGKKPEVIREQPEEIQEQFERDKGALQQAFPELDEKTIDNTTKTLQVLGIIDDVLEFTDDQAFVVEITKMFKDGDYRSIQPMLNGWATREEVVQVKEDVFSTLDVDEEEKQETEEKIDSIETVEASMQKLLDQAYEALWTKERARELMLEVFNNKLSEAEKQVLEEVPVAEQEIYYFTQHSKHFIEYIETPEKQASFQDAVERMTSLNQEKIKAYKERVGKYEKHAENALSVFYNDWMHVMTKEDGSIVLVDRNGREVTTLSATQPPKAIDGYGLMTYDLSVSREALEAQKKRWVENDKVIFNTLTDTLWADRTKMLLSRMNENLRTGWGQEINFQEGLSGDVDGRRRIRFLEIIDAISQPANSEFSSILDPNMQERHKSIDKIQMHEKLVDAGILKGDGEFNNLWFDHRMKQVLAGKREHFTLLGGIERNPDEEGQNDNQ